MAGRSLIGAGAAFLLAAFVPAMAEANNLNVTTGGTHIPIRPHVNLNATINVGVKARTFHDIDLSQTCRADERIKVKGKREWRCRQDRQQTFRNVKFRGGMRGGKGAALCA